MDKIKTLQLVLISIIVIQATSTLPTESLVSTTSVITVPGDYPYISWAIANATDGDIILVDAWSYGGIEPYPIEINKTVVIKGVNGTVEIRSLPDIDTPITTSFLAPRTTPLQLPNITIENITFNITTPLHNTTTFLMLNGAGSYEILLKNVTMIGNRTTLPNLTYTLYLTNAPMISIDNLTDRMPGETYIVSSNIVNVNNITRINTSQLIVNTCNELSIENYESHNESPYSIYVLFTPQIYFNNITIENSTIQPIYGRLISILIGTSDDYNIQLYNITILNTTTSTLRSSLLHMSTSSTLPSSITVMLDNYRVIQQPLSTKPVALSMYMYNMNNNTRYQISNVSIEGAFYWPFSLYNTYNMTIKNITVISSPGDIMFTPPISYADNIVIENAYIKETGIKMRNAKNVTIINPVFINGSIILQDSDVDIWYPKTIPSGLKPLIEGYNSTFRAYGLKPSGILEFNMSIGNDALNTSYKVYLISFNDIPVKPPATVIVSPLMKIDTSNEFNVTISLKYNGTILQEKGIKEHLLGILKHNGTAWLRPSITYTAKDFNNDTLIFTIKNAGDPIIVLYSYPISTGGKITEAANDTNIQLLLITIIVVIGFYTIIRRSR